jgi:hypothetical protein
MLLQAIAATQDAMSVYRKSQYGQPSDVHATPIRGAAVDISKLPVESNDQPPLVAPPPVSEDVKAMRKLDQTASILQRFTAQWAETLPSNVQPRALMREYPRIANMVALLWTEPTRTAFDDYMESLLVDRRGNRKGFPAAVASDLLMLRQAFDERYRHG